MALFLKSSTVFFYNINKLTYLLATQLNQYQKKPSPTYTHEEEEGFAQTARSTVWIHCA